MIGLDPERFNRLIGDLGVNAVWRRGYACPCVDVNTGAPSACCPHCRGIGRVWVGGVQAVVGKASSKSLKDWMAFGRYDDGDAVFTIGSDSPAYAAGPYDRLQMVDMSEPFSLNLTRGVNDFVNFPIISIERVLGIEGGVMREYGFPDVNQTGDLEWPTGGPPNMATYSLTGRRFVEYFVSKEQPLDRPFHQGRALPRKVVVKRFDLLRP